MTVNYKVKLQTLTPLHIGSGEAYDPTQFVIDKQGIMRVFQTSDFLAILNEEQLLKFSVICKEMNLVSLFRFFNENYKESIRSRSIKISRDLQERYNSILKSGSKSSDVINQFELKRTAFNECHGLPFIPGSSLKGSLKTAWMSSEAVKSEIRNSRNIRDLESGVLRGSFDTDPFRFVKIPDLFPVEADSCSVSVRILYATNHHKKAEKNTDKRKGNMPIAFEVVMPGATFEGSANLGEAPGIKASTKMEHSVDLESLVQASQKHYWPKLLEEEKVLAQLGCKTGLTEKIQSKFSETLFKTSFLIRLGHHSGAECVTIDDNRTIKIMQGPGKTPKFDVAATTIWLASNQSKPASRESLAPFGWAMVEFSKAG